MTLWPIPLLLIAAVLSNAVGNPRLAERPVASSTLERCTIAPPGSRLLMDIVRDTTLPFGASTIRANSYTVPRPGTMDTLYAQPGTLMPAARVRVLRTDSATRAALAAAGVSDTQPVVFIRAAPYGADCRTIRYLDTLPWAVAGDRAFARAELAPDSQWVDGVPVFVVPETWLYPYPRQRGLALYGTPASVPLAPADAYFDFVEALGEQQRRDIRYADDSATSARARAWAAAHPVDSELEPIRTTIRNVVLRHSNVTLRDRSSRLRGTWRVLLSVDHDTIGWYLRTVDKPAYTWQEVDSVRSTADIVAAPHSMGYRLVAYGSSTRDSVIATAPRGMEIRRARLNWLAIADQPWRANNDTAQGLTAELMFKRGSVPQQWWKALDPYVPPPSVSEQLMINSGRAIPPEEQQPRFPLTLRRTPDGVWSADTTFVRGGHTVRVTLTRVDSVAVARPF